MKDGTHALKEERRKRVADVALHLFVQRTYDGVGVRDIAAASGMSIGSLYDYFSSKEDILDCIVDGIEDRWRSSLPSVDIEGSVWPVLEKTLRRWIEFMDRNADGVLLSYQDIRKVPFNGRAKLLNVAKSRIDMFGDLLKKGIATGEFRPVDVATTAYLMNVVAHHWVLGRWYWAPYAYTLSRFTDEQVAMIRHLLMTCDPTTEAAIGARRG